MAARPSSVDLFCRVVDNLGDIGVCWRLARQLVAEAGIPVRLVVDRLDVAQTLVPAIDPQLDQQDVEGIRLVRWRDGELLCEADLVIEAFACELPPGYLLSMAQRKPVPAWVNLEYLSAEAWVPSHHGLPSPHPRLPLSKHFFFPGFVAGTGGLLRENSIKPSPTPVTVPKVPRIFAFTYDAGPIDMLTAAIASDGRPASICVPAMEPRGDLERWRASQAKTGLNAAPMLEFVPFVPQSSFDELLASHDLLLVRGEDSLVRALWSGKPFAWQLYRQEGDAHLPKLEAFLAWYARDMPEQLRKAWQDFSRAWNGVPGFEIAAEWPRLRNQLDGWGAYASGQAANLMRQADLMSNLLSFFGKLARI
ncbi:MAG: elongation factor P maturation arginine rhamnosyltransferase EarP [Betaproteobacteria bacterium]|nr:elongation factor P maturation arginine rhamnosyltransferase EarP [Betaproteobacteria bacterium]